MSDKIILFKTKEECCGCGACMNICPRNAISMQEDEYGFIYPHIDVDKCVSCGLCKKVCSYQNESLKECKHKVFASAIKTDELIMQSASGGMFVALANKVLEEHGVVFGATLRYENDKLNPMHIWIERKEDLYQLQGSKYVQSAIGKSYSQAKLFLEEGKLVLFSGTPCQIAGLKGYLQKDYDNLLTVDLICHGVPNANLFHSYISYYERKYDGKIIKYNFRDKKSGQGMTQAFTIKKKNGEVKIVKRDARLLAFVGEFEESNIIRENCYSCKYASSNRISDITLGDFWGVNIEHPDKIVGNELTRDKGISCLITNSEKGETFFNWIKENIYYFESDMTKVVKHNKQLCAPSKKTSNREKALEYMAKKDYEKLEEAYRKRLGLKYFYYWIGFLIPSSIKNKIKDLLKK